MSLVWDIANLKCLLRHPGGHGELVIVASARDADQTHEFEYHQHTDVIQWYGSEWGNRGSEKEKISKD